MFDSRNFKARIIAIIVILAVAVLLLTPQTSLHQRSRKYIQDILAGLGSNDDAAAPDVPTELDEALNVSKDNFDESIMFFQLDVPQFTLPEFDFEDDVLQNRPHNWQGPGQKTFATFFATRSTSMSDPYFIAAQQIIYRVLWDPRSRSQHSMTVFVAPFVSIQQRKYFAAAGAVVRELPLHEFMPKHAGTAGRLRDMFTKLEMWNQMDFSKIAYLDSDAFPLRNVDEIFDLAGDQHCNATLLSKGENHGDICNYTFAGYQDFMGVNAGVLVFNPNEGMHGRLVKASLNQSSFDNGFMEQALLNKVFAQDGPFPPTVLSHAYNGGVDTIDRGEPLYIVHHKLWATGFDREDAWHKNVFGETWSSMLSFYSSEEFRQSRWQDGR